MTGSRVITKFKQHCAVVPRLARSRGIPGAVLIFFAQDSEEKKMIAADPRADMRSLDGLFINQL